MVNGKGFPDRFLTESEIQAICADVLESAIRGDDKVLFVLPDHTRSAPIDVMFRTIYGKLCDYSEHVDFLIALGTHPPMTDAMIDARVGITGEERRTRFPKARFFNHRWNDPDSLISLGTLSETDVGRLSGGRLSCSVDVTINKMVLDYDRIVIVGPVFPHEVVGFSGGSKYLFPGIAGAEIIDMFHWLGALITNMEIIGRTDTPVREVINRAASLLDRPVDAFCLVVKDGKAAGLFAGPAAETWQQAARLSEKLHIVYKSRSFGQVLSCAPRMYDDLWTGAKCMYKLEPVVADGGELIIYAPHICDVSVTHGKTILDVGYHVRDYFVHQWDRFRHLPWGILAHSTHVKGLGRFENGVEKPRIRVTLATSIPENICRKIDLGYRDPASIDPKEWMNREAEGILYVPKAGEMLYRLEKPDSNEE